jgi:hypothetical protein
VPIIDEHVRAVGREVRQLARLHGALARTEASQGLRRFVIAVFLFAVGVAIGALGLAAFGMAAFFMLAKLVDSPGAAALVALCFFVLMMVLWFAAWRLLRAAYALTLPRTRQMIWELLKWQEEPTDS